MDLSHKRALCRVFMKKNYILDTNVFVYEPDCLFLFEDNDIYISPVTLRELDHRKDAKDGTEYAVRKARRNIDMIRGENGNLKDGVSLGEGLGMLRVVVGEEFENFPYSVSGDRNDDHILAAAAYLNKFTSGDRETILVTDDTDMRLFADLIGVKTQRLRSRRVSEEDASYNGRSVLYADSDMIAEIYKKRSVAVKDDFPKLEENEFVTLMDVNSSSSALCKHRGGVLFMLDYLRDENNNELHPFGVITRNAGQKFMQEMLMAPAEEVPLVIIKGPAGSAKTFMSIACGLEQVVNNNIYESVLITRANVPMDRSFGYLPGEKMDKVAPMLGGFFDNSKKLLKMELNDRQSGRKKQFHDMPFFKDGCSCPSPVEYLIDSGQIQVEAMEYMRGRSIDNTYIIVDEAQNLTPSQAHSILTRAGNNSKIILLGDPDQIDAKYLDRYNNGLVYIANHFKGNKLCYQLGTLKKECIRSPLAAEAAIRLSGARE